MHFNFHNVTYDLYWLDKMFVTRMPILFCVKPWTFRIGLEAVTRNKIYIRRYGNNNGVLIDS